MVYYGKLQNNVTQYTIRTVQYSTVQYSTVHHRVVFWSMGIMNSFTLEASYGGSNLGSRAFTHFNTGDYQSLGRWGLTYCYY